jgi:hypothetical protein
MRGHWLFLLLWVGVSLASWSGSAEELPRAPTSDSVGVRQNQSAPKAATATPAPNPLIYPPRRAQLPAAHRVHAEVAKLECVACHVKATSSNAANDWLGPRPEQCTACHAQRFDGLGSTMPANQRLRFSHAKHAARAIACSRCHIRVAQRADALGSERLPLMSVCLQCHSANRAALAAEKSNCKLCHVSAGSVIKTRFREGMLTPRSFSSMRHDTGWLWQHGEPAMIRGPVCLTCHEESDCVNCHNGRLRPRQIHPSDWLRLHGIESRQSGAACNSCHRSQSECLTCHLRAGLSPGAPGAARLSPGRFHPPSSVWTDRPRTARHHATQARLHMDECVSCHQERDCASCHASAGVGGPGQGLPYGSALSPHPAGFRSMCSGLIARNPRPCMVCHGAQDPRLIPCR